MSIDDINRTAEEVSSAMDKLREALDGHLCEVNDFEEPEVSFNLEESQRYVNTSFARANAAVQRGISLLDAYVLNWWKSVDLGTLNLSSGDRCICGQVFGPKAAKMLEQSINEEGGYDLADLLGVKNGYDVVQSVDALTMVVPGLDEDLAVQVANDPWKFGFNYHASEEHNGADIEEGQEWAMTMPVLQTLWENEIRTRIDTIRRVEDALANL